MGELLPRNFGTTVGQLGDDGNLVAKAADETESGVVHDVYIICALTGVRTCDALARCNARSAHTWC